jgi:hypothetical protein
MCSLETQRHVIATRGSGFHLLFVVLTFPQMGIGGMQ